MWVNEIMYDNTYIFEKIMQVLLGLFFLLNVKQHIADE
jgi:hypothetical protein